MEAPAYWSLDRKDEKGMEKAFVVSARAIDFAIWKIVSQQRELGRKSDCFKSMGRVNTHRS
jgi:hypothetical protein